jgi:hypothetical protein
MDLESEQPSYLFSQDLTVRVPAQDDSASQDVEFTLVGIFQPKCTAEDNQEDNVMLPDNLEIHVPVPISSSLTIDCGSKEQDILPDNPVIPVSKPVLHSVGKDEQLKDQAVVPDNPAIPVSKPVLHSEESCISVQPTESNTGESFINNEKFVTSEGDSEVESSKTCNMCRDVSNVYQVQTPEFLIREGCIVSEKIVGCKGFPEEVDMKSPFSNLTRKEDKPTFLKTEITTSNAGEEEVYSMKNKDVKEREGKGLFDQEKEQNLNEKRSSNEEKGKGFDNKNQNKEDCDNISMKESEIERIGTSQPVEVSNEEENVFIDDGAVSSRNKKDVVVVEHGAQDKPWKQADVRLQNDYEEIPRCEEEKNCSSQDSELQLNEKKKMDVKTDKDMGQLSEGMKMEDGISASDKTKGEYEKECKAGKLFITPIYLSSV